MSGRSFLQFARPAAKVLASSAFVGVEKRWLAMLPGSGELIAHVMRPAHTAEGSAWGIGRAVFVGGCSMVFNEL